MTVRAIGGVMPAIVPQPVEHSVWDRWTAGFAYTAAFSSARSALAALIRDRQPGSVWLPAYVCQTLYDGVVAGGAPVKWYFVDEDLEVTVPSAGLRPGDAMVVVDYFGSAVACDIPEGVLVIEDRAQALDPGVPAFGDVVLYSPRKLLGVGDGGLMVSNQPLPQPDAPSTDGVWDANDLRARDPDPAAWRPAFIAREAGFEPDTRAMTQRTEAALRGFDPEEEIAARRANWAILADGLPNVGLWSNATVGFAPLAYPIRTYAVQMAPHLAAHRIWAPRHWADLPSPTQFHEARELSQMCVSLPLDGRYGPDDMGRIIQAVRSWSYAR